MGGVASLLVPSNIDFARYYLEAEAKAMIFPAPGFLAEVVADLAPAYVSRHAVLPWAKVADKVQFRPGEVTLWPGVNGHGKSYITGMVMTSLCAQGEKVGIASFEMKPRKTLGRQLRQASKEVPPNVLFAHQFISWLGGKLWLYDHQGLVKVEVLYGVIKYMAQELGITHVLIDSLMKCVKGEDDYNGQKDFIGTACSLARDLNIHIHIVHHTRKTENEERAPNKFDVKGSGAITDQVDNVFLVWRNKKKEREHATGKNDINVPDAIVICDKQRNGDWEGAIGLWVHRASWQFLGGPNTQPMDLMSPPIR